MRSRLWNWPDERQSGRQTREIMRLIIKKVWILLISGVMREFTFCESVEKGALERTPQLTVPENSRTPPWQILWKTLWKVCTIC
jgi:hypothetical protein